MRGTFANVRIRNQMAPGTEGGYAVDPNTGEVTSVFRRHLHTMVRKSFLRALNMGLVLHVIGQQKGPICLE